ncbi:auxin-induced protein 6B-like [Nymphaea colorata]|nr:auxin-induced protein 6B-like [Nymphaea colorata]
MTSIRLSLTILAKKQAAAVFKGHLAAYVGDRRKRFAIPTPYLKNPSFQALLRRAEEEFGFEHHSGLAIPCNEDAFQAFKAHMSCAYCKHSMLNFVNVVSFFSPFVYIDQSPTATELLIEIQSVSKN